MPDLARKRAYIRKLRPAASRGDTTAMLNMGEAYRRMSEFRLMFQWFRNAAKKHDGEGLLEAGYCYQFGVGTRKDLRAAERAYRAAISNRWTSESGREEAMLLLATLLLSIGGAMAFEAPYLLRRANVDHDYPQAAAALKVLGSEQWRSVCVCRRDQPRKYAVMHCALHNPALANNPIKRTVPGVTPRAVARVAPPRPAAYRARYTDTGPMNDQRPCPRLLVGPAIPPGRTRTRTAAWASVSGCHARRPAFTQASRSLNTLVVQFESRQWQALAGLDSQDYAEDFPYNSAVNASVRPVTPLAVASVAPVRPARYRARWPDDKNGTVS